MKHGGLSKVTKAPTGSCFGFRRLREDQNDESPFTVADWVRLAAKADIIGLCAALPARQTPTMLSTRARRQDARIQHAIIECIHCAQEKRKCEEAALDRLLVVNSLGRPSWSGYVIAQACLFRKFGRVREAIETEEADECHDVYRGDGPEDGPVPLLELVDTMYFKAARTGLSVAKILTVFLTWAKPFVRRQVRLWMDSHRYIRAFEEAFPGVGRAADDCAGFICWLKRWQEESGHEDLFEMPDLGGEDDVDTLLRQPTMVLGEELPDFEGQPSASETSQMCSSIIVRSTVG